jgi:Transposase, Mutator family
MATHLDAQVEAFRNRPLDAAHYTFVWLDALVIKAPTLIGHWPGSLWQRRAAQRCTAAGCCEVDGTPRSPRR